MRVRIKGKGPGGAVLDENGDIRRTRKSLITAARELHGRMTPAEKILWTELRGKKLHGLKFYRQVPVDRFIVDFYCPEKKLVIELDGEVHQDVHVAEDDKDREVVFRGKGLRILRFQNAEVQQNLPAVCSCIIQYCSRFIT